MYTVGDFLDPKESDAAFVDEGKARMRADDLSREDEHRAIAVWRESDLLFVYLRGYELQPT